MNHYNDDHERYARHLILREVGGAGQAKLLKAKVLIVGAGGLGSPALLYLAAAGVGEIGIVDDDRVQVSNLQRQIAHGTPDIGRPKTESAREAALRLNPGIRVNAHTERLDEKNALALVSAYDLALDGSDNFATRFLVNDACYFAKRTLVSAAVSEFDGQVGVFKAHLREGGRRFPCYRCFAPEAPPRELSPPCSEAGIIGALTGIIGSLAALEVLKEILAIGESLAGRLLLYDGLNARARGVTINADPRCALCGEKPSIRGIGAEGA